MNQNVRSCVSDMPALAPLDMGPLVGESAAPQVLLFGPGAGTSPLRPDALVQAATGGGAPTEAAGEEGRRQHGGDPL